MWRSGNTNLPSEFFFLFLIRKFFSKKRNWVCPVSVSILRGVKWKWNDDDLTCFTFCQISLYLALSFSRSLRHRRESRREKGSLEKDFEICEPTAIPTCPPFLSLSLPGPFFSLRDFTAFCKKKKRFFFFSSQLGFVGAGGIKKDSLYLRKVIDRYIIRTARYLLECHHVIDKTTCTRLHTYTHTHIYIHSPEIWKEKRRCYSQPTCLIWCVFSYLVSCVCVCVSEELTCQ